MDGNCSKMSRPILLQNPNKLQVPVLKHHNHAGLEKQDTQLVCCKKRKGKDTLEESSLISDQWENLDPNILKEILCRLPVIDLFLSVSSVCQSWEATCWDYMFRRSKVLDLSGTGAGFGMIEMSTVESLVPLATNGKAEFVWGYDWDREKVMKMENLMRKLWHIMETEIPYSTPVESWRTSLTTVIFPYLLEISDKHLLYIAERTPSVRHLKLLCPSKITAAGFVKALQYWKHLTVIHLGPFKDDSFAQFINGIGANCQEIKSLHIHQKKFLLDRKSAYLIAQNCPGLENLELELGVVEPSGIIILYNMCRKLEEVYFNKCQREDDGHVEQKWIGPDFDSFRLTWRLARSGYLVWEVTPCFPAIKQFMDISHRIKTVAGHQYVSDYLEKLKANLQPLVEEWFKDCRVVRPVRNWKRGWNWKKGSNRRPGGPTLS